MTVDPFAEHDAAYVLGALSPEDRRAYEAHLAECEDCALAVRELAGMPGLLARVPLAELEEPTPEPPATLLPSLGRALALRRQRARRRWVVAVGAVAATVLALTLAVGLGAFRSTAPPPSPTGIALSPVAVTPLHASARVVDVSWGARIDLTCTYDSRYSAPGDSYTLVVVDRAGHSQQVAAWSAVPGMVSRVSGASAWHAADIARLEVRTAAGTPVLQLST